MSTGEPDAVKAASPVRGGAVGNGLLVNKRVTFLVYHRTALAAYSTEIILPNFNWLFEGSLAAMAYPLAEEAFTALHEKGIRAILNLAEEAYLYVTPARIGMQTRHIPVLDFSAPTLLQAQESVAMISSCLERHHPVAVHCLAGLGRTGTILACYLVATGTPAGSAIMRIRQWRPGSIETTDQEAVVYEYERICKTQK